MSGTSTEDQLAVTCTGWCRVCRFEPESLDPGEATEALMSLPRRLTDLLSVAEAEDPEIIRRPLPPAGWSALEHAGHLRDALHTLDMRMQRLVRQDCPCIPETPRTAPVGANDQGREVILAPLRLNAGHLARTIAGMAAEDWSRAGLRRGQEVNGLDLAREAVHEVVHHLHLVEHGLATAREGRRPVS